MSAREKLAGVVAGDRLVKVAGITGRNQRIVTVVRTTPTLVMIAGVTPGTERRFRRTTGRELGAWSRNYATFLRPVTPDDAGLEPEQP